MTDGPTQLRAWITRARLTQRQAADLLGVHWTFLNQMLNGHRGPGLANAVRIRRLTGVTEDAWLPTEVGKPSEAMPRRGRKRKVA